MFDKNMLTMDNIKKLMDIFATKEELKQAVEKLATKEDLKSLLAQQDLFFLRLHVLNDYH